MERVFQLYGVVVPLRLLKQLGDSCGEVFVFGGWPARRGHDAAHPALYKGEDAVDVVAHIVVHDLVDYLQCDGPGEARVSVLWAYVHQNEPPVVRGEELKRLVYPDTPPPALGELVPLIQQVLGGGRGGRHGVTASVCQEKRGEYDDVERYVVFAHEEDHPGLGVFPELGPLLLPPQPSEVLNDGRYVAKNGLKPDVDGLPLGAWKRRGDAPPVVSSDGAGPQALLKHRQRHLLGVLRQVRVLLHVPPYPVLQLSEV